MGDQTKTSEEGVIIVDSADVPKIRDQLNKSVAQMSAAVLNIEKHDAKDLTQRQGPVWVAEMKKHLRHFRSSKAVVEYASWMLGQAQEENTEKAARELARTQALLARRLNCITAIMTAAVIVQALVGVVLAWRACR